MTRLLKKHQWLFFDRLEEAETCAIPKKIVSPGLQDTDQCLGNGLRDSLQRGLGALWRNSLYMYTLPPDLDLGSGHFQSIEKCSKWNHSAGELSQHAEQGWLGLSDMGTLLIF